MAISNKQNIYKIKVEVKGLEDKINRIIEIEQEVKVSSLVCTVLASMDAIMGHKYDLYYRNLIYSESKSVDEEFAKRQRFAKRKILKDLELEINETMEIIYGANDEFTFRITLLEEEERIGNVRYPKLVEENGYGIVEDIIDTEELKEIISKQENEYENFGFTIGFKYLKCLGEKKEVETYVYNMPLYSKYTEEFNVLKDVAYSLEQRYNLY